MKKPVTCSSSMDRVCGLHIYASLLRLQMAPSLGWWVETTIGGFKRLRDTVNGHINVLRRRKTVKSSFKALATKGALAPSTAF